MSFSLLPQAIFSSVPEITLDYLHARGIALLMLDFDNTIVPYTTSVPTERMRRWLDAMRRSDVRLCVVSNSRKPRVAIFCQTYGIPCVTRAKKPFSRGIHQCLERFQLQPSQCALVGDQIFTDVLGANCAGVSSLLVPAICNHTILLKLRHVLELPFIFLARGRSVSQ